MPKRTINIYFTIMDPSASIGEMRFIHWSGRVPIDHQYMFNKTGTPHKEIYSYTFKTLQFLDIIGGFLIHIDYNNRIFPIVRGEGCLCQDFHDTLTLLRIETGLEDPPNAEAENDENGTV